jgi:hypothetical protein
VGEFLGGRGKGGDSTILALPAVNSSVFAVHGEGTFATLGVGTTIVSQRGTSTIGDLSRSATNDHAVFTPCVGRNTSEVPRLGEVCSATPHADDGSFTPAASAHPITLAITPLSEVEPGVDTKQNKNKSPCDVPREEEKTTKQTNKQNKQTNKQKRGAETSHSQTKNPCGRTHAVHTWLPEEISPSMLTTVRRLMVGHMAPPAPLDPSERTCGGVVLNGEDEVVWKPPKARVPFIPSSPPIRAVHLDAPLHVKHVPLFSYEKFEKILSKTERHTWEKISAPLFSPQVLVDLVARGRRRASPSAALTSTDVDAMVAAGIARRATSDDGAVILGSAFSVDEVAKHRRRAINHPGQVNDFCSLPLLRLPHPPLLLPFFAGNSFALTADLAAWYYQFPLPLPCQKFFGFLSHTGEKMVMCRMPMGASFSCAIAHFVSSILARYVCRSLPLVSVRTYIDNFCFVSTCPESLRVVGVRLKECEREFSCLFGEIGVPLSSVDFLGYEWDLKHQVARICEKRSATFVSTGFGGVQTRRDVVMFFGRLFSLLSLSPHVLSGAFYVLKFYRRVCNEVARGFPLDAPRPIWPSLFPTLSFLLSCVGQRFRTPLSPVLPQLLIASDASKSGWGGVRLGGMGLSATGGPWDDTEKDLHINVQEGLAVVRVLLCWKIPPFTPWLLDSSVLYYALKKGYSPSLGVNDVVNSIQRHGGGQMSWRLVASAENPADLPSRCW